MIDRMRQKSLYYSKRSYNLSDHRAVQCSYHPLPGDIIIIKSLWWFCEVKPPGLEEIILVSYWIMGVSVQNSPLAVHWKMKRQRGWDLIPSDAITRCLFSRTADMLWTRLLCCIHVCCAVCAQGVTPCDSWSLCGRPVMRFSLLSLADRDKQANSILSYYTSASADPHINQAAGQALITFLSERKLDQRTRACKAGEVYGKIFTLTT